MRGWNTWRNLICLPPFWNIDGGKWSRMLSLFWDLSAPLQGAEFCKKTAGLRGSARTRTTGYRSCYSVQSSTSKLQLATKIAAWNFHLLFKFGQDCFVEVNIVLFSYFCTYCINVSHAIPYDIKHYQQAESTYYFDYTNWRLKICTWRLYFSSWSPKGNLTLF